MPMYQVLLFILISTLVTSIVCEHEMEQSSSEPLEGTLEIKNNFSNLESA